VTNANLRRIFMTKLAPFTVLIAAHAKLRILDPVAGPVERSAESVKASDEVLVFVGGKPAYRPIALTAPSSPPERCVSLPAASLAPKTPIKDLLVAAGDMLAVAFPVGSASVAAEHVPSARIVASSGHWVEITVQGADALVASGLRFDIGGIDAANHAERTIAKPETVPLAAHIGVRQLPVHGMEQDGILSTFCFTIPPRTTTIRLSSPSIQPPGDPRHLGVAICRLMMDKVLIPLDSPALVRGFHRSETAHGLSWRWTDGEALLILPPRSAEQVLLIEITDWHNMLSRQDK
jgi:hypothetical protein